MDLTSLQSELVQAGPVAQSAVDSAIVLLAAFSTWFWSVRLDRLFASLGAARRLKSGAAPARQ